MSGGGQVNITVVDSGSATVIVPNSSVQLVLGTAPAGPIAQIVATRSPQTLQTTFSGGPMIEAAALSALAGGTILAMRVATNAAGVVRHPNTVAITTASNANPIVVTTSAPHGLATGDIVTISGVAVNTAANGTFDVTVVTSTTFTIPVAGSGAGTGGTVAWGGLVYTGTGTLVPTVSLDQTNGAWDDFYVKIVFTVGGTIGTSGIAFTVSLDAGRNFGPPLQLGTATTYAIPNTGITLVYTATQTVVANDAITFSTTGPAWNAAGVQAALNVFLASQYAIQGVGSIHLVGVAAGSDASTIEGYLDNLATNYVYARMIVSARDASPPALWGGTAETEATWMTAILTDYSAVSARRIGAGAAYWNMPSAFPNPQAGAPRYRRPVAWAWAARQVTIPPQRHAGRVSDGSLSNIVVDATNDPLDGFIYHDERVNAGLDYVIAGAGGRFASTMTRAGYPGVFLSNPLSMAPLGSNYFLIPLGLVIDVTSDIVHQELQLFIDSDVRLNRNGTIYEGDAQTIEGDVSAAINAVQFAQRQISQPVNPGQDFVIDRTWNVQANNSIKWTCNVVARGYILRADGTIGFQSSTAAS